MDQTALAPVTKDPLAGAVIADRYVVEECVGEGGMGRVYRARHRDLGRMFAIKVLYGEFTTNAKMRARFAREARTASSIDHPNLVPVIDVGSTEAGLLYLVMSYVEGRDLHAIFKEDGPLAPARARRLLRQLCEGLAHAHDRGLVHRDLKGQNVLVSGAGAGERAHILDFGLAFMREESPGSVTTDGLVLGTPAYMSPEQSTGGTLDHRTDLFSLGVLVYQMLTGVLPFAGSAVEVARKNLTVRPPRASQRVPGLIADAGLEAIAFRLMEKMPEDRFQSAQEVIAALDRMPQGDERAPVAPVTLALPGLDTEGATQPMAAANTGVVQRAPSDPAEPEISTLLTRQMGSLRNNWRRLEIAGALLIVLLLVLVLWPADEPWLVPGPATPGAEIQLIPNTPAAAESVADTSGDTPLQSAEQEDGQGEAATTAPGTRPRQPERAPGTKRGPRRNAQQETQEPHDGRAAGAAATERAGTDRAQAEQAATEQATTEQAATEQAAAEQAAAEQAATERAAAVESAEPDLEKLYTRTGQKLADFQRVHGAEAAAPLWKVYRSIPLADALRTPALGQEAMTKLRRLERELASAPSAPP
jgi:tRNA A-37 threonylcarbamoyl transferase component Bud32